MEPRWNEIEEFFAKDADSRPNGFNRDAVPSNVREWQHFRQVYEACVAWLDGTMPDPSWEGITTMQRQEIMMEYLFHGNGHKRSPMECSADLDAEIRIFLLNRMGINLQMCINVMRIWVGDIRFAGDRLPRCLKNHAGNFICRNDIRSMENAPEWIDGKLIMIRMVKNGLSGNQDDPFMPKFISRGIYVVKSIKEFDRAIKAD